MIVLNVCLDNFYAFKDFQMNLTYPKRIVDSYIRDEHLKNHPNFRYKKVNIIMGANASGKTTFGYILRGIFNFISQKNHAFITDAINDRTKTASFTIDLICDSDILYRITCSISPKPDGNYDTGDVNLEIRKENIWIKDSYESCIKRLEASPYHPCGNYLQELDKMESLAWLFEYPRDTKRTLYFDSKDEKFPCVLENILKALDPSVQKVEKLQDVENTFVIRLRDRAIILQSGSPFDTDLLSSGTKAGVEIAMVVSALLQGFNTFYYCDEKFSYIHSDIEKAVLSLMIDSIRPNEQLFFTTHNTDILDMDLPKHTFTFLRKTLEGTEHLISCVSASSLLKRSSDSLKNAVENDMFSTSPLVDLIYAIAEL
ncbi:MAG: ATP-binding protein [Lachnospiraceae bacterium]|nr:ATP-binding protein [Lachnospiraceae bacterium]